MTLKMFHIQANCGATEAALKGRLKVQSEKHKCDYQTLLRAFLALESSPNSLTRAHEALFSLDTFHFSLHTLIQPTLSFFSSWNTSSSPFQVKGKKNQILRHTLYHHLHLVKPSSFSDHFLQEFSCHPSLPY